MKFIVLFALIAAVSADPWGAHAPVLHAPVVHAPIVHHAPVVHHAVALKPIYQTSLLAQTVKLGETHHAVPVTEHRFTRTDYETPGATYAIPAVRSVAITRPAYTTYINSAVTKAHVTNHQVAGPTVTHPIIKPVVTHALAPIAPVVHHAPALHAPLRGWW